MPCEYNSASFEARFNAAAGALARETFEERDRWSSYAFVAAMVAADKTQTPEVREEFRLLRDLYTSMADRVCSTPVVLTEE